MENIPQKLRIYVYAVIFLGALMFFYFLSSFTWGNFSITSFLLFLTLSIMSDSLPVHTPKGGYVTVSFAIYYAAIILYGASFATLIAFLGDLLCSKKQMGKLPWYKDWFNKAELILAVGLAGSAYEFFNPGLEFSGTNLFWALSSSFLVFLALNVILVAMAMALAQDISLWQIILVNMKWALPNLIALAPLGILIALIYNAFGLLGVALLVIPLLIARHSFQAYIDMRDMYLDTIQSLAAAIDAKDPYTKGHSERVADYSVKIARALKLPEARVEKLKYVALLHDIGKMGIREQILNKPSMLTVTEFDEMKKHSVTGAEIVGKVRRFQEETEIIRHHHERWDGKGYPDGLKGTAIPLGARIVAVADTFDAMTSDRPYRKALTPEEALKEIEKCAGTQLDPDVVKLFCEIFPSIAQDIALKKTTARQAEVAKTGGDADAVGSSAPRTFGGMVS